MQELIIGNPEGVVAQLRDLQRRIRDAIVGARQMRDLALVDRETETDTIYKLDVLIEPIIADFCEDWGQYTPMVVVSEGIDPPTGLTYPRGLPEEEAHVRILLDPVDGTRELMYDKRPGWSLAGVAPNKGAATRLSDIEVAVMTELPTTKMSQNDVLWAIKGQGAQGVRENVYFESDRARQEIPIAIQPSDSDRIDHGFASIADFFPGTKVLAGELMEYLVYQLTGKLEVGRALVFEDQYISTGGQFYELIVGHDRFSADLRWLFYQLLRKSAGLCVHPYDACTALIAQEAGVILTDGLGRPFDGPFNATTSLAWAGYANETLRQQIEPILLRFFEERGIRPK